MITRSLNATAPAIRMAAYNSEITLARILGSECASTGDQACTILREALTASGDITPGDGDGDGDGTLTVRLDPLSAPRRTRAIAALCNTLNAPAPATPAPA